MLVSGRQGFLCLEPTYGVSRIAHVVRFCCARCCLSRAIIRSEFPLFRCVCFPCHYDSQANQQQLSSGSFFQRSLLRSRFKYSLRRDVICSVFAARQACSSSPLVSAAASANPLLTASTAVLSPDLVSLINQAAKATRPSNPGSHLVFWRQFIICVVGWLSFDVSCCWDGGFQPSNLSSLTSGRPIPLVVPSFGSTFTVPVLAIVSSSGHALSGVSTQLPPSIVNLLADQPFVMGPGFSPVPTKLDSQICSRKYVDL